MTHSPLRAALIGRVLAVSSRGRAALGKSRAASDGHYLFWCVLNSSSLERNDAVTNYLVGFEKLLKQQ